MDRSRKSEKPEPVHQPVEPEMPKTPEPEPAKEKRADEL
jgi:hypothetical protein